MRALIDNKIQKIRIVNLNYNDDSVEVELLDGAFKGAYAIVSKSDLIKERKQKRFCVQIQDFNYVTGKWHWKVYYYCETEKEAMKHRIKYSNIRSRIFDRVEGKYL